RRRSASRAPTIAKARSSPGRSATATSADLRTWPIRLDLNGPSLTATSILLLRPGLPINSHVIDQIFLREDRVVNSLLTAPGATDGEVEDEVLVLVERPGIGTVPVILECEVLLAIDEEIDVLGVPLHGVHVKRLGSVGDRDLIP